MSGANGDSASYATELERVSRYAQTKIDGVLKDMLEQLFLNTPEDPIDVGPGAERCTVREPHMSSSL